MELNADHGNEDGLIKKPPQTIPPSHDRIQAAIGSLGKYQYILGFFLIMSKVPCAFQQMSIIFLAPPVSFICPDTQRQTCPCDAPIYNTSVFTRTIKTEWNLICNDAWLSDFTQTISMVGVLVGSIIFGMASDRFGRKKPLVAAIVIQLVAGIVAAYAPDFWSFTILRTIIGAAVGGTMVVGFVLTMEFVGTEHRSLVSAIYQIPFNIGHMLLPIFAFFLRDYSDFQLAISIPTAFLLLYVFLPESPRWLVAVNETDKAIEVLEYAAKVNNMPIEHIRPDIESVAATKQKQQPEKGTMFDLFRTPNLRRNTIVLSFNWAVAGNCFYGISQYVGTLNGNIFINVMASASMTLAGTLISIPLMKLMGRKTLIIAAELISAACLLSIAILPTSMTNLIVGLACTGNLSSFVIFVGIYLHSSELFPTVVRNVGVGICSMMARIGSMAAPFVVGLSIFGSFLPPLVFGVIPLIGALSYTVLPETRGCDLTTTLEEGENFGTKPLNNKMPMKEKA